MAMTPKQRKTMSTGLRNYARSKIGKRCHFTNPETGEVVEGIYRRGRQVTRMVGMTRMTPEEAAATGAASGFNIDEQTFTVPRHIPITFGQAPAKGE